jgi:DNA-binding NtrC family response regulator
MSAELSVLIVDDDKEMADTLADILTVEGFKAKVAYSGEDAVKMIQGNGFDCVVADIKMPGISGVELNQLIKESKPDLPMVLMTAYSVDSLVQQGEENGVITTLTKPLDIGALLLLLKDLNRNRGNIKNTPPKRKDRT